MFAGHGLHPARPREVSAMLAGAGQRSRTKVHKEHKS
jgi:hypothetical protein